MSIFRSKSQTVGAFQFRKGMDVESLPNWARQEEALGRLVFGKDTVTIFPDAPDLERNFAVLDGGWVVRKVNSDAHPAALIPLSHDQMCAQYEHSTHPSEISIQQLETAIAKAIRWHQNAIIEGKGHADATSEGYETYVTAARHFIAKHRLDHPEWPRND